MTKIIFMNTPLLLHNRFKRIGWIILIPATLAGVLLIAGQFDVNWLHMKVFSLFNHDIAIISLNPDAKHFVWIDVDFTNTLIGVLFIIGGLMVAFSKEKQEDEFIAKLRLSSLMWSVWVNYFLLLIGFLFIYGTAFLNVMIYNMFTVLIIFIIRFNFILYRNSKMAVDEK